jgi:hypothetical protein
MPNPLAVFGIVVTLVIGTVTATLMLEERDDRVESKESGFKRSPLSVHIPDQHVIELTFTPLGEGNADQAAAFVVVGKKDEGRTTYVADYARQPRVFEQHSPTEHSLVVPLSAGVLEIAIELPEVVFPIHSAFVVDRANVQTHLTPKRITTLNALCKTVHGVGSVEPLGDDELK